MALQGRVIDGKYCIGSLLGAGGMGEVYEAVHQGTERVVAVKVLHPEYVAHPDALVRFNREARAAGRIGHDNICDVIDVGCMEGGAPYIVMPLLRGKSLSDVMKEVGPLPVARCVDVVGQILSALAAAHDARIVHRDLKPENVFLVRMGDRDDFVKLLDFGIAKVVGDHITDAKLTQTGTVMGTPYYMSPEQARGIKNLDHRVDLYATAVMLYEMLTTRTPFEGDTYNQILSAILMDPFPPPRSLRKDIPPAIEAVVLRAMARDRDQRFPDAKTMREALMQASRPGASPDVALVCTSAATLQGADSFGDADATAGRRGPGGEGTAARPAVSSGVTLGPAATAADTGLAPAGRRRRTWLAAGGAAAIAAAALAVALIGRTGDATQGVGSPAPAAVAATSAARPLVPDLPPARVPTDPVAAPQAQPEPAVPAVPAPGADAATIPGEPEGNPIAAAPAEPAKVLITLTGLPPNARIQVEGNDMQGPSFELVQGERDVPVEVTARGLAPWRRQVSAREAATIEVRMRPAPVRPPPPPDASTGRDTGPARPGTLLPFGEEPWEQ